MIQEPGAPGPSHNQFLATPEQLAPYEAAFAPFAETAYRIADKVGTFRSELGFDPYGRDDVYEGFSGEEVCALKKGRYADDDPPRFVEGIPEIKGAGSDKWVSIIDGPDGKKYALKGIRLDRRDPRQYGDDGKPQEVAPEEQVRHKLLHSAAPLIQGEGQDGLEQLIAVDLERNLMVTSTISPGELVMDMSGWEISSQMRRRHVEQLARLRLAMQERGLHHHNAGGILFSKEQGFLFVDYTFRDEESKRRPWLQDFPDMGEDHTTESFIQFITEDHRKLAAMEHHRRMGSGMPRDLIRTTGMRATWQGVLMRWAREIDARLGTGQESQAPAN